MKRKVIKYSAEELHWISDNRALTISDLHQQFCRLFYRIDVSANNLHALRKRKGWKTGRTGQFKKGNIPHPNAHPKGANRTSFKAGNRTHNLKPVGSTRVSKDGYIMVKIQEPSTWRPQHILNWESEHGNIPDSYCVVFIDGNKLNTALGNLELITRNENLQINRLRCSSYNKELQPVVRNIGKLVAKTYERQ